MNAVRIDHFTKRYGNIIAVNDLSLEIKEGEFFGFLGPNGAGKTTTISCLTGIGQYAEGTIEIFGHDVKKEYREARKQIGLCPQEFNANIFESVKKMLWYNGGYFGIPREQRQKRMDELLKILDLTQHADKPFRALSGGLKRRAMLARAMMHDPKLLILDEPTAGVDVELRHELWKYLRRINEEGKTILFTSHYLEEVEQLCNRIAIINGGKIVAIGDKSDFVKEGKSLEKVYLEVTKK